jgi:hypothetical protein
MIQKQGCELLGFALALGLPTLVLPLPSPLVPVSP